MQSGAWNIFYAFHKANEFIAVITPAGRKANSAISHNGRGNAVVYTGLKCIIPAHLSVVMCVQVDKARRDNLSFCINSLSGWAQVMTYFRNNAVAD